MPLTRSVKLVRHGGLLGMRKVARSLRLPESAYMGGCLHFFCFFFEFFFFCLGN